MRRAAMAAFAAGDTDVLVATSIIESGIDIPRANTLIVERADTLRAFCQGQIAHYKIPRYIEFVAEFPMTITGKIQKFVMREQTIDKLGLKTQKTA